MHAFVEIGLLCIHMPIEVNDAELASIQILGDSPHGRKAKGMVSAKHDGQRATGIDVRDPLADLIERLFDVAGNGKHVAEIAHGNGFPKIHAEFEAIGSIQCRNFANALWAESCAGPIGCAAIERRSENGHIVLAAFAYVFDVRRFDKGVDPGEVGEFSPAERGNPLSLMESAPGRPNSSPTGDFFFPLCGRQQRFGFDSVFCLRTIVVMQGNLASVFPLFRQRITSLCLFMVGHCLSPY